MYKIIAYDHSHELMKDITGKTLAKLVANCYNNKYNKQTYTETSLSKYEIEYHTIIYDSLLKSYKNKNGANGTAKFWFLFYDETLCGFTMGYQPVRDVSEYIPDYMTDYDNFHLSSMYVLPQHQGKGLGKHLINTIIEFCKQNRYKSVYLNVKDSNFQALRFYKFHQFNVTDYVNRYNMFTMYKEL